jgi:leucine dehydrogenase
MGMKASAKMVHGNDSLTGKKVFVQGIGHVGENLVKHLIKEGAKVTIHDINQTRLKEVSIETGAEVFSGADIFDADMDIYSPCALGASINDHSLSKMKCSIIAGAANNQLEDEQIHGQGLLDKGIVWAPDFLINAGGLINVYSELHGYNRQTALSQAEKIYQVTLDVLNQSKENRVPSIETAKLIAEKRIASIGKIKLSR